MIECSLCEETIETDYVLIESGNISNYICKSCLKTTLVSVSADKNGLIVNYDDV